jgi:hypothetical protein
MAFHVVKNNQSAGEFESLSDLVDEISNNPELKEFGHSHDYSFCEFIEAIKVVVKNETEKQIRKYIHFTVIIDDSKDKGNKNEMCIYVRYLDEKLEIKEVILKMNELGASGAKSEVLEQKLEETLTEWGLDMKNMIGFASDGGSNMRGRLKGLAAKLKTRFPWIVCIHCRAHLLHLAAADLLKGDAYKRIKDNLAEARKMINYVNGSAPREAVYNTTVLSDPRRKTNTTLHTAIDVRWLSLYKTLDSSLTNYESLLLYFKSEAEKKECTKWK